MDKIREERIKLTASFLNIAAAGANARVYLALRTDQFDGFTLSGAVLVSMSSAAILHFLAHFVLGYLRAMSPLLVMALPSTLLIVFAIGLCLAFAWTAPAKPVASQAQGLPEFRGLTKPAHPKVSDT